MRYRFYLFLLCSTLCSLLASALTLEDLRGQYDMIHGGQPYQINLLMGRKNLTKRDFRVNGNNCSSGSIKFTVGTDLDNTAVGAAFTRRLEDRRKINGTIVTGRTTAKIVCGNKGKISANLKLNVFVASRSFTANFSDIFKQSIVQHNSRMFTFVKDNRYLVLGDLNVYLYRGIPQTTPSSPQPPAKPDRNTSLDTVDPAPGANLSMASIPGLYVRQQGSTPDRIAFLQSGPSLQSAAFNVSDSACQSGEIFFELGSGNATSGSGSNFTYFLNGKGISGARLITGRTLSPLNCSTSQIEANVTLNLFVAPRNFSANWTAIFPRSESMNTTLPYLAELFSFQQDAKYLVLGDRAVFQAVPRTPPETPMDKPGNIWIWAGPLIGAIVMLIIAIILATAAWKCHFVLPGYAWYGDRWAQSSGRWGSGRWGSGRWGQNGGRDEFGRPSSDYSAYKIPWHSRR